MDFLSFQARLRPGDEAVYDITSQRRWTYEAWDGFVSRLVTWLSQQGVYKGDRLVCLARNSAETVALHLACGRAGVLFVPLNWRLSQEELMQLLDDCEPSLVCGDKEADRTGLPYVALSTLPDLVSELTPSATGNENAEAPSLILYTSGTTGLPKGIVHTEETIMETTQNMALLGHVDEHSTFLCETPMFHVIGLISCVRPALYFGGRLIISDGFEPARTFDRLCDPDLAVIAQYGSIQKLWLTNTGVTDAGLVHLQSMPNLRVLGLARTNVTDAGLPALGNIRSLREVYLYPNRVSDNTVDALKQRLPGIKVVY